MGSENQNDYNEPGKWEIFRNPGEGVCSRLALELLISQSLAWGIWLQPICGEVPL